MKLFILPFILICTFWAEELQFYTEDLPPYNYIKNRKIAGISTLFLEEIMKQNGTPLSEKQIKLGTWQIGYDEVLKTKNSVIYSTARLPNREELFKWVGPIDKLVIGVIAKKSKNIVINSPEDFNNYITGTLHRTAAEQLLKKLGVKEANMDKFSNIKSQLLKLENDRVDMVAFSYEGMKFVQMGLGINYEDYELVYVLKKADLYFAFNKETDDALIEKLNMIANDLRKKGFVKKIKSGCGL